MCRSISVAKFSNSISCHESVLRKAFAVPAKAFGLLLEPFMPVRTGIVELKPPISRPPVPPVDAMTVLVFEPTTNLPAESSSTRVPISITAEPPGVNVTPATSTAVGFAVIARPPTVKT
jgi:hypothetical protein